MIHCKRFRYDKDRIKTRTKGICSGSGERWLASSRLGCFCFAVGDVQRWSRSGAKDKVSKLERKR